MKERRKSTAKQSINLARKYHGVLDTGNASPLLALTPKKRQHVMRALSSLSKFQGRYPMWQEIIKAHQLSWSIGTDAFNQEWIQNMIDGVGQIDEMLQWLRDASAKLPAPYCNAIIANCLTGLRVEENYECMRLLRTDRENYVMERNGLFLIMHFKYPATFFRKTKKGFLSIVNKEAMQLLESLIFMVLVISRHPRRGFKDGLASGA